MNNRSHKLHTLQAIARKAHSLAWLFAGVCVLVAFTR